MMTDAFSMVIVGAGQSGLAAAHAALRAGLHPLVLEASGRPAGSWPHYYDSLTLFSPARYSALPGMAFPGDPDRYPHRDEVISYLERYARELVRRGAEIRTGVRVSDVTRAEGNGFEVRLSDGGRVAASNLIAASGSFAHPYRPALMGLETFAGQTLHVADYRDPEPLAGRRVVVVGAGNSAVQVAYELANHADVTLASRAPVRLAPQRPLGRDLHFWFRLTGFDRLPLRRADQPPTQPVLDDGRYREALRSGRLERRPMFRRLEGDKVEWADGRREQIDVLLLATGYRPDLGYLASLGALDGRGRPRQVGGLSCTHAGLGYLGLEWQRTPASNSLRGVGVDARQIVGRLVRRRQA
ncbi:MULTISPECIES: NAD(P)-binding domain-containing protein [unclassified Nonomuraea]|uniref:flavin-containing monooxygenase n=1 Tax=unclassified Nonomuraea TaxID=2593643 RepID=UPI0033C7506D